MRIRVSISGASDDTVEISVNGKVAEEINVYDPEGAYIDFPTDTRVHISFSDAWWLGVLEQGDATVIHEPLDRDPQLRTERVHVEGDISWVDVTVEGRGMQRIEIPPTQNEPGS